MGMAQNSSPFSFWRQTSSAYRNFQIVFTYLTLNFLFPGLLYAFAPVLCLDTFVWIDQFLGGKGELFPPGDNPLWRFLGVGNVLTLSLMCFMLQLNLKRFYPVLIPLTVMKLIVAISWASVYVLHLEHPFFGVASLLDFVTGTVFVIFTTKAYRDLDHHPEELLVPRFRFQQPS